MLVATLTAQLILYVYAMELIGICYILDHAVFDFIINFSYVRSYVSCYTDVASSR